MLRGINNNNISIIRIHMGMKLIRMSIKLMRMVTRLLMSLDWKIMS